MTLRHLFKKIFHSPNQHRQFNLDEQVLESLEMLAKHRQSTPQAVAADLVQQAMETEQNDSVAWDCWLTLTPREQEVAAYICQGYTSRQIAEKLNIANETVRTHARKILSKFGTENRQVLRDRLRRWDFSQWK
jgi:DNA-binding NarL/FixJ family response regulator